MRTLAIDPGPVLSAFVVWDSDAQRIFGKGKIPNDDMREIARAGNYDEMVIEGLQSFGMPVGSETFQTGYMIGRLLECCPWPSRIVYRLAVKTHHCHSTKAKDGNVRQAIIDRLGPPGTKKAPGVTYGVSADVWSALAIALYHQDTRAASC